MARKKGQSTQLEDAMGWNWTHHIAPSPNGAFMLTIDELPGFVMYHNDETDLLREMPDALRAELRAYQSTGREIPEPTVKLVAVSGSATANKVAVKPYDSDAESQVHAPYQCVLKED